MSDPVRRLLASLFGCIFFGYAAINCLIFYRRMRAQAAQYHGRALAGFVRSPQYSWTIWIAGGIGAIGFLVASWQLVLSILAILRGT